MSFYITVRDPPEKRRPYCTEAKEHHLTEAAVMIAFAMHLMEKGAATVEIHPDGEHGKRYDIRKCLTSLGFTLVDRHGATTYGGVYKRGDQSVIVSLRAGLGDVVAKIEGKVLVAEAKGGITNTRHQGQVSKLRRGLCEAVGLLMVRPPAGERHIAVVPEMVTTRKLAERIGARALAAGIEIALVGQHGEVRFLGVS
jgi:hypothetical protein